MLPPSVSWFFDGEPQWSNGDANGRQGMHLRAIRFLVLCWINHDGDKNLVGSCFSNTSRSCDDEHRTHTHSVNMRFRKRDNPTEIKTSRREEYIESAIKPGKFHFRVQSESAALPKMIKLMTTPLKDGVFSWIILTVCLLSIMAAGHKEKMRAQKRCLRDQSDAVDFRTHCGGAQNH